MKERISERSGRRTTLQLKVRPSPCCTLFQCIASCLCICQRHVQRVKLSSMTLALGLQQKWGIVQSSDTDKLLHCELDILQPLSLLSLAASPA